MAKKWQRAGWRIGLGFFLALLVGLLWGLVFKLTGLLWWNAPITEAEKIDPPPVPPLEPLDTGPIDTDEYRRRYLRRF